MLVSSPLLINSENTPEEELTLAISYLKLSKLPDIRAPFPFTTLLLDSACWIALFIIAPSDIVSRTNGLNPVVGPCEPVGIPNAATVPVCEEAAELVAGVQS